MSAAPGVADPRDVISFDLRKVTEMTYAFGQIRTEIYIAMFLLCLVGYFSRVWNNRDRPETHFMVIPHIALLIVFGAALPHMRPLFMALFYYPAEKLGDVAPLFQINEAMNHFDRRLAATPNGDTAFLDSFSWNVMELTRNAIVSGFFYGLYLLMAAVASLIATPFYFLQVTLVETCFAFSPIAFGCLAVPALKDKGAGFLTMLASIMSWPMGFAVVAAMTNITLSAFPAAAGSTGFALGPLLSAIVAAAVMLVGTLMVPPTAFYLFMHGGTVFNPVANAVGAVPYVGRMISAGGRK